jgi:hypothetical protein
MLRDYSKNGIGAENRAFVPITPTKLRNKNRSLGRRKNRSKLRLGK